VITGGRSGIGRETALASRGAAPGALSDIDLDAARNKRGDDRRGQRHRHAYQLDVADEACDARARRGNRRRRTVYQTF
jgi:NAD(P)-dependent dehydrogenase (short-subunit alcohol dehydrogenase family)